jgi:zinc protease
MVVAGPVKLEEVKRLSREWFGPIPAGKPYVRRIPAEPVQSRPVPGDRSCCTSGCYL